MNGILTNSATVGRQRKSSAIHAINASRRRTMIADCGKIAARLIPYVGERGSCRAGTAKVRQEPHRLTLPSNELVGQSRW